MGGGGGRVWGFVNTRAPGVDPEGSAAEKRSLPVDGLMETLQKDYELSIGVSDLTETGLDWPTFWLTAQYFLRFFFVFFLRTQTPQHKLF